jgi:predicted cupin superfamily sugar epimerase
MVDGIRGDVHVPIGASLGAEAPALSDGADSARGESHRTKLRGQSGLPIRRFGTKLAFMTEARALIDALDLMPHPEGGWYRETWRADAPAGERAAATAILFLLEEGQRSHWHKVDATELWLFHAGSALRLETVASDEGPVRTARLGPDAIAGDRPQVRIAPGEWQAATADRGWALVSCIVSPGFEFAGFTLAPPDWLPGG